VSTRQSADYVCEGFDLVGAQYCEPIPIPAAQRTASSPPTCVYSSSESPGELPGTCTARLFAGDTCSIACETGYVVHGTSLRGCDLNGNLQGTGYCIRPAEIPPQPTTGAVFEKPGPRGPRVYAPRNP